MARDAAEAKARDTATELAAEQAKASLEEKTKALAAKEAEVAAKEAQLASVMRASRLSASSSVRQTPRLNSHPPLRS